MGKHADLVKSLYRDEAGQPIVLTAGQEEIFEIVVASKYPRTQAVTYSQYGKSLTCALGALTRASTVPEKTAIVAPSNKKAQIIMGYLIDHLFDNSYTRSKFVIEKDETIERIRRERRKDRVNFKVGDGKLGEIFTLSTEARRTKDVLDALMGFGAQRVLLDESSLISNEQYAGVKRMLGGHKDSFLFEIGNPFYRNHFFDTSRDPNYHHILVDYKQGIAEGRITQKFIDEMRSLPMFSVLYECQFPDETAIDAEGYSPLLTTDDLDRAYAEDLQHFGRGRISVDVSGGGRNYSVILYRSKGGAEILYREQNPDTMSLVGIILRFVDELGVSPRNIFVDEIGVGKGVSDRLKEELGLEVAGVNVGDRPATSDDFMNLRAQAYWDAAEWIKGGGKLKRHPGWEELLHMRYKVQSDKKIKMISKDELLKRGVVSPDIADALMLTFIRDDSPGGVIKPVIPQWKGYKKK